ncbi:MAG: hypothetical protein IJU91_03845 [Selenomonadaceae bacterium]|nr:hypothetical protein [Selenomonadaceae bacterium]
MESVKDAWNDALFNKIEEVEKEKESYRELETRYTELDVRCKKLERERNKYKNAACHFRDTTEILDMLAAEFSKNEKYPYTSLCIVETINSEGIAGRTSQRAGSTLKRLADVEGNKIKTLSENCIPEKTVLIDAERNYTLNSIGVWGWRTEINPRCQDGDEFTYCTLYEDRIPIEIIVLPDCKDDRTLEKLLTQGIEINLISGKAFITYPIDHKTYCGIFLCGKNFETVGNHKKIKLKNKNIEWFEVSFKDIVHVAGKMFYNRLYICSNKYVVDYSGIEEKWRLENEEKISAATKKIEDYTKQLEEYQATCAELEKQISDKQAELESISSQIETQKIILRDIAHQVAERIETARKNVTDFICETIFVNAQPAAVQSQPAREVPAIKNYRHGKIIESDDVREIESIQDFIYDLETAIGCEGVTSDMMLSFSIYLCSAYRNKFPLLLAGPNGRDIADAFSVVLTGKTAAILDCAGVNSLDDLNACVESDDEVIAVLNPFSPNFMAYLPEIINLDNKFIFAIYPFAEDLRIEPRSLYNYFLPVLTELIIAKRSSRDFYSTGYNLNSAVKKAMFKGYTPDDIPISAAERIKKLTKDMKEIAGAHFKSNADKLKNFAVLFTKFPLAYVKGNDKNFLDNFNGDEKIAERIRAFLEDE